MARLGAARHGRARRGKARIMLTGGTMKKCKICGARMFIDKSPEGWANDDKVWHCEQCDYYCHFREDSR